MKSIILTLFISFLCTANIQSQDLNYGKLSRNDWGSIMRGNQPMATKKSSDVELRGTPFVYDTYEKGVVIVSDSLHSQTDFKLKLNAEDNEIWILNEKKEELVLTDKRITGLDLIVANDTHSFRKVILPDVKTNPNRFVEVLYGGTNFTLIKHTEKLFEAANAVDKGVAVIGRNYDSYITTISYYILTSKKVFKKIGLKKNDIYKADLALVEKNRDAINAFCKEQKISNPLEEEDAVDLVEFIDKLK
jgi:hypothetical protein